jgi:hypothetical protein
MALASNAVIPVRRGNSGPDAIQAGAARIGLPQNDARAAKGNPWKCAFA